MAGEEVAIQAKPGQGARNYALGIWQGLCGLPVFWGMLWPHLCYWAKHGQPEGLSGARFARTKRDYAGERMLQHWDPIVAVLQACWFNARRGRRVSLCSLPVLGNPVASPCDGCGGLCCQSHGGSGFSALSIYWWEPFAKRHRTRLEPSEYADRWLLRFDQATGRCPFLTATGSCSEYRHRPVCCATTECVDGLDHSSRSCMTRLVDRVPQLRARLVQLGYVKQHEEAARARRSHASQ